MLIQSYPVGWAVSAHHSEPFTVFLIDLPGVAMQGRTFAEAFEKLAAVAPTVLEAHRADGTLKPPSPAPPLQIGAVRWMYPNARSVDAKEPEESGPGWQLPSVPVGATS